MAKYVLSPQAQQSLKEIHRYSEATFGPDQARRYLTQLRDRMQWLAEQPHFGKQRDDIKPGYYSYFEGSRTVYYRTKAHQIEIIDVLHQRMDPIHWL